MHEVGETDSFLISLVKFFYEGTYFCIERKKNINSDIYRKQMVIWILEINYKNAW